MELPLPQMSGRTLKDIRTLPSETFATWLAIPWACAAEAARVATPIAAVATHANPRALIC
jgi:hypothetical protein